MSDHQNVYGICENLCKVPVYGKGQVDDLLEDKVGKPQASTNGDFASFDADGNVVDSNKKASDFANANHNQSASTITAGTLAGKTQANATAQATLSNSQIRDISADTTDLTAGTSTLASGTIYLVYES